MSIAEQAAAARAALDRLLGEAQAVRYRLPPSFSGDVERFVALLLDANRRMNLTRLTHPDDVALLHLVDSLAALPLIDRFAPLRVIDIGSGGGLPGIPLALARPDIQVTLVDAVAKKAGALHAFVDALGMPNVSVLHARAETMGRDTAHRERYDLVTARACAGLPTLVELTLPLARIGGRLLAWKGPLSDGDPEVERGAGAADLLGGGVPHIEETDVARLGGHRFVMIEKLRTTPERFPRRPGEPARRPLG